MTGDLNERIIQDRVRRERDIHATRRNRDARVLRDRVDEVGRNKWRRVPVAGVVLTSAEDESGHGFPLHEPLHGTAAFPARGAPRSAVRARTSAGVMSLPARNASTASPSAAAKAELTDAAPARRRTSASTKRFGSVVAMLSAASSERSSRTIAVSARPR